MNLDLGKINSDDLVHMITGKENRKVRTLYYSFFTMFMSAMFSIENTFGAGQNTFFSKAKSAVESVYDQMFSIVTPLAGLCALIAIIIAVVMPGRGFESGVRWLVRIFFGYMGILALGWIFAFFEGLTAGGQL